MPRFYLIYYEETQLKIVPKRQPTPIGDSEYHEGRTPIGRQIVTVNPKNPVDPWWDWSI
jgi:hypothetical protein